MIRFFARRFLVFLLSLWNPGLGQLHNGQVAKALWFFGGFWLSIIGFYTGMTSRSFLGLGLTQITALLVYAWAVIDAVFKVPRASNEGPRYSRTVGIVVLGVALSVISAFVIPEIRRVRSYSLRSISMEPTLQVGDRLIASHSSFQSAELRRGQIVIFKSPEDPSNSLIKRIVALPGEVVAMRGGVLKVDEVVIPDWTPDLKPPKRLIAAPPSSFFNRIKPLEVPPETVYVLGDNRQNSRDSRVLGPIPVSDLLGEPLYWYWSSDKKRIGKKLQGTRNSPD